MPEQQSELLRDLFDAGWREREAARNRRFLELIPSRAPCAPSQAMPQCVECARYNPSIPDDHVQRPRMTEVIDATVVAWPDGVCPMREVIQ